MYDIKAFHPQVHKTCTGVTNELILNNLQHISNNGAKIEIRIPLVMGYNDVEIPYIGEFLSKIKGITKIKLLKYHSFSASRYSALGLTCSLPDGIPNDDDIKNALKTMHSFRLNAIAD